MILYVNIMMRNVKCEMRKAEKGLKAQYAHNNNNNNNDNDYLFI